MKAEPSWTIITSFRSEKTEQPCHSKPFFAKKKTRNAHSQGLAYGIALCAMRRSTHAAIRSIQRRLWFYPINFWLSFGFKFACDLNTDLFGTIVGVLAAFFLALNGFLNGATYFFHSRLHHGASRGVATQCVESGEVRLANIVSFHAIFPHDIEQVIEIGGSTFGGSVYAGSTFAGAPSMPLS